jgi:tripartite-type tricarboxylate transporter receptor subunit TctC
LGIFVPAQTPKVITTKLYRDIARTLNTADVKKKLLAAGVEPVASTPDELANFMTSEALRMSRIIKKGGAGEN